MFYYKANVKHVCRGHNRNEKHKRSCMEDFQNSLPTVFCSIAQKLLKCLNSWLKHMNILIWMQFGRRSCTPKHAKQMITGKITGSRALTLLTVSYIDKPNVWLNIVCGICSVLVCFQMKVPILCSNHTFSFFVNWNWNGP